MLIRNPSPKIVAGIESGLAGFERVKVTGFTKTKIGGKTVYEPNPSSTEIYWARFHNLETSKSVFPGRDGVPYASFEEMAAHDKFGYDYHSTLPNSLLKNGQRKWRKMLTPQSPEG